MNIVTRLRQAVKFGDFFNTSHMLRFDTENEYRTFTGGLISIGIIITITIAFTSMITDTLNRATITFTRNVQRNGDPPLTTITISPQSNFMFAVQVLNYNLSSQNRLYDVIVQVPLIYNKSDVINVTYIPLETCTREHWAILPDVLLKFDNLNVSNWLCPKMGTQIILQGKLTSQIYSSIKIILRYCSNNTDPDNLCASEGQIYQAIYGDGTHLNYFNFYYVNSMVNAGLPQYKSYYLQDRTFIPFNLWLSYTYNLYVKEIAIETDISILPFQDIREDSAYYIEYAPILTPLIISPNSKDLAYFTIMADYSQQSYQRQVQKIFVVFSFIGGLVGAILASLFIVNNYTDFAYQIALSISLFRDKDDSTNQEEQSEKTNQQLKQSSKGLTNILHFLQCQIYSVIKKVKPSLKWPLIEYIQECRGEVLAQLDIKHLIKRIIFLEYAVSGLLGGYELQQVYKNRPVLPAQIKQLRQQMQGRQCKEGQQNDLKGVKQALKGKTNKPDDPNCFDPSITFNIDRNKQIGEKQLTKIQIQKRSNKVENEGMNAQNSANGLIISNQKYHFHPIEKNPKRNNKEKAKFLQVLPSKNIGSVAEIQNAQVNFSSSRKWQQNNK